MVQMSLSDHPGCAGCGIDAGSTLTKVALRDPQGQVELHVLPGKDVDAILALASRYDVYRIGVTGGGAKQLLSHLGRNVAHVSEFSCWGRGCELLLRECFNLEKDNYLLISVGTGTSIMLINSEATQRVGGTAVGGGTVLGLCRALSGMDELGFEDICAMARFGRRNRVDLFIGDVYQGGCQTFGANFTASNFGRMALPSFEKPALEDMIAAVLEMVGETIALMADNLATHYGCNTFVYCGTTLEGNSMLQHVLRRCTRLLARDREREILMLEQGQFCGALGALTMFDDFLI